MLAQLIIAVEKPADFVCDLVGRTGLFIANGIGKAFVFTDIKPIIICIRGIAFEYFMQMLDDFLIGGYSIIIQDKVKGAKVIHGFDDIITVNDFIAITEDGMGVEEIYGMFMAEFAAFNAVAVVGKAGLGEMINAFFVFGSMFRFELMD